MRCFQPPKGACVRMQASYLALAVELYQVHLFQSLVASGLSNSIIPFCIRVLDLVKPHSLMPMSTPIPCQSQFFVLFVSSLSPASTTPNPNMPTLFLQHASTTSSTPQPLTPATTHATAPIVQGSFRPLTIAPSTHFSFFTLLAMPSFPGQSFKYSLLA